VSQVELAQRLGLSQSSFSAWEGAKLDLTVEQVRSIEEALDLEPGFLLVAGGYVSVDLVAGLVPDALSFHVYDDVGSMQRALEGIEELGLGARLWNEEVDEGDFCVARWQLVVSPRPPMAAQA
jgi:transcriptional regulator with XRE-family HTH domain